MDSSTPRLLARHTADRAARFQLGHGAFQIRDEPFDDQQQRLHLDLHDAPDNLDVDAEVVVDQLIAHARNASPRNVRARSRTSTDSALSCFPKHLQIPRHGVLDHFETPWIRFVRLRCILIDRKASRMCRR